MSARGAWFRGVARVSSQLAVTVAASAPIPMKRKAEAFKRLLDAIRRSVEIARAMMTPDVAWIREFVSLGSDRHCIRPARRKAVRVHKARGP
jgi:hypothetical protein